MVCSSPACPPHAMLTDVIERINASCVPSAIASGSSPMSQFRSMLIVSCSLAGTPHWRCHSERSKESAFASRQVVPFCPSALHNQLLRRQQLLLFHEQCPCRFPLHP